jgi:hypothetical protein
MNDQAGRHVVVACDEASIKVLTMLGKSAPYSTLISKGRDAALSRRVPWNEMLGALLNMCVPDEIVHFDLRFKAIACRHDI